MLMLAGVLSAVACSSTAAFLQSGSLPMQGSQLDPSAQGEVRYKNSGHGQNTKISVEVNHLAEPQRVDPAATVYIVWVEPKAQNAVPQNVGVLKLDSDLHGKLETVSPYETFRVFVTPEKTPTVQEPTGQKMLTAEVPA
jgi:hypothetical protein